MDAAHAAALLRARGLDEAMRAALQTEFLKGEYSAEAGEVGEVGAGRPSAGVGRAGLAAALSRFVKDSSVALDVENYLFDQLQQLHSDLGETGPRLVPDPVPAVRAVCDAWNDALFERFEAVLRGAPADCPLHCERAPDKRKDASYADQPVGEWTKAEPLLFADSVLLAAVGSVPPPPSDAAPFPRRITLGACAQPAASRVCLSL